MAELLGCRKCGAAWSAPKSFSPVLLKYTWCNDCGGQDFIPIGAVYGVTRPPVHIGVTAPQSTYRTPLLMLTDGRENPPPPTAAPSVSSRAVGKRRIATTSVLQSGPVIPMGATEGMLKNSFFGHAEGDVFSFPHSALIKKYFPRISDSFRFDQGQMQEADKDYARLIAIFLCEKHASSLKIQVPGPKGSSYKSGDVLRRDLLGTLNRIAHGEGITKNLTNKAYNNDGCQTMNSVRYDRYGKNYKGARPNSPYLPAPSTSAKFWEFYVDRDATQGASQLTIGQGRPGIERLFLGPPDYVYYTWNHYGSDVEFGPVRSALTESDIWAVYSYSNKRWQLGLTR